MRSSFITVCFILILWLGSPPFAQSKPQVFRVYLPIILATNADNTGFELGSFIGWNLSDADQNLLSIFPLGHTGRYSARFSSVPPNRAENWLVSPAFVVYAGQMYQVSGWVNITSCSCWIGWGDETEVRLMAVWKQNDFEIGRQLIGAYHHKGWSDIHGSVTAIPQATRLNLAFAFVLPPDGTLIALVDDVSVK